MDVYKKTKKLMKKKESFREYLMDWVPPKEVESIWEKTCNKLSDILIQFPDVPKGEKMHAENSIFPNAAFYLVFKELYPEKAFDMIEDLMARDAKKIGDSLKKCVKIPGFKSFFLWSWDPGSRSFWGPKCGFDTVFYPKEKYVFKMDIYDCPYRRYTTQLGCFEINKLFCEIDIHSYGDLPGMKFTRTQTLATGGKLCDFKIEILRE